jgi:hypothetical protein
MTDMSDLYELLDKAADLKEPENFLNICDEIICKNDITSIPILLKYFRDTRDNTWVFEHLMIAMESYPEGDHIRELLVNLDILLNSSQTWTCEIFNRILNSESARKFLLENIDFANKKLLFQTFKLLSKEYPHHISWLEQNILTDDL